MPRDALREEELESRWEAAPAVAVVIAMQLLLALVSRDQRWKLWIFPWWVWLIPIVPELLLLLPLAWHRPRRRLEQLGHRRTVAISLLAVVSLANAVLLLAVIASLVRGDEKSGAQLLLKATTVWTTNAIAFGLWYWAFDRGGPARRLKPEPPWPDFQFPQMENARLAPADWQPELVDYLYVSFTNSIAPQGAGCLGDLPLPMTTTRCQPLHAVLAVLLGIANVDASSLPASARCSVYA